MCWWLDDNAKLIKENKRLSEENKKLKNEINKNEDSLILDIVNAFMVKNNLIKDFDKYIHTHSMSDVRKVEDKIREVWGKL